MSDLAARIHEALTPPKTASDDAVLAVVEKCEQMRAAADRNTVGNSFWAHAIATEFEQTIARALGITD